MEQMNLQQLVRAWTEETHRTLALEEPSNARLRELFRESYRVLSRYAGEELIPKEIAALLLEMDDFLYFASLMEEKEKGIGFYHWEALHYAAEAMKKGFFEGAYPEAYPVLLVADAVDNTFLWNVEEKELEAYVHTVMAQKSIPL